MTETLDAVDRALRALVRGQRAARLHRDACRAAGLHLDPPAFFLLSALGEQPTRLTDLAGRIGLDPSTISRKLQDLEQAGLTRREGDPADRRAAVLELSPDGREVVRRVEQARLDALEELLADWSEAERLELARVLTRFAEALSRRAQPVRAAR